MGTLPSTALVKLDPQSPRFKELESLFSAREFVIKFDTKKNLAALDAEENARLAAEFYPQISAGMTSQALVDFLKNTVTPRFKQHQQAQTDRREGLKALRTALVGIVDDLKRKNAREIADFLDSFIPRLEEEQKASASANTALGERIRELTKERKGLPK